jgi:hypothetical protein
MSPAYAIRGALVLFVALLWAFHFVGAANRKAEERLVASRGADRAEHFVESFPEEMRPIASAVYGELQEPTHTKRVPFMKTDSLSTLRMDTDDLDDAMQRVAEKFSCRLGAPAKAEPKTVQDLVELLYRVCGLN